MFFENVLSTYELENKSFSKLHEKVILTEKY